HVDDSSVVVAYEMEDEVIEQVYDKSQFVQGKVPKPGDRLEALVHVANGGTTPAVDAQQLKDEVDEIRRIRSQYIVTDKHHEA
ncbi:MAG TPA: hypothetical protein VGM03_00460, partial [Phycisphaerae bacterium]